MFRACARRAGWPCMTGRVCAGNPTGGQRPQAFRTGGAGTGTRTQPDHRRQRCGQDQPAGGIAPDGVRPQLSRPGARWSRQDAVRGRGSLRGMVRRRPTPASPWRPPAYGTGLDRAAGWREGGPAWGSLRGPGGRELRARQPCPGDGRRGTAPPLRGLGLVPRGTGAGGGLPAALATLCACLEATQRPAEGRHWRRATRCLGPRTG